MSFEDFREPSNTSEGVSLGVESWQANFHTPTEVHPQTVSSRMKKEWITVLKNLHAIWLVVLQR